MDLANWSSCEGFYIELSEFLLPVWAEVQSKCLFHLLFWHNMSIFSCFFEGLPDGGWDEIVLLDAEHLGYFQRSSSHFAELFGYLMCSSFIYLLLVSSSEAAGEEGFNFDAYKLSSEFSIFSKSSKSAGNYLTLCSLEFRFSLIPLFWSFKLQILWGYLLLQYLLVNEGLCLLLVFDCCIR